MIAPRDGGIDPLQKYGGERNIIPSDEQVFHSLYPPKGELRWQTLEADSDQVEVNYEGINWDTPYERLGSIGLLNLGYAFPPQGAGLCAKRKGFSGRALFREFLQNRSQTP